MSVRGKWLLFSAAETLGLPVLKHSVARADGHPTAQKASRPQVGELALEPRPPGLRVPPPACVISNGRPPRGGGHETTYWVTSRRLQIQ